jgi:nucleoside-diphosphate-sugar epimerase
MSFAAPLALVTGAPGWLGTRLVETLLEGLSDVASLAKPWGNRRVRCLVQPGINASPLRTFGDRVELVEGDITDAASLGRFFSSSAGATLVHAAAVVHPRLRTKTFHQVNATGTFHVVEAAERAAVRRMIHISSNSPLGVSQVQAPVFDESSPYNPYMEYGRSKMAAEKAVLAAKDRGKLETVIVRPPWFYGPNQPPRQELFIKMVRDGRVPIVGDGDNLRSMTYIDNLCQGILLCERVAQAKGGIYWIADRRHYSMNEIIETIATVLERDFGVRCRRRRLHLPWITSELAWCIDKGLQSVGLYHQKVHVLSEMNKTIACSVAKAEQELGYDPKVELAEGMRRSIRSMLGRSTTDA